MLKSFKYFLIKISKILFNDEFSIKLFFLINNKPLNLKSPLTFTDKLNYLKIHERNELITQYSDKILLKNLVSSINGLYISKILWIGTNLNFKKYDFKLLGLGKKVIIKTNHFSGDSKIIHVKDLYKNENIVRLNNHFKQYMRISPYDYPLREWSYRNIDRKLFIEEYLGDNLTDYKFFCFNGVPKIIHVVQDRRINIKDYFLNTEWKNLGFTMTNRSFIPYKIPKKPKKFKEMIYYAKLLSKNFKFVRVDFYYINGKIYIGEMTFYPWAGMYSFKSIDGKNWDKILGEWLNIN